MPEFDLQQSILEDIESTSFELGASDFLNKFITLIEKDPAEIKQGLLKTRGMYEKMISEQPVGTRAFSPLRAAQCIYRLDFLSHFLGFQKIILGKRENY